MTEPFDLLHSELQEGTTLIEASAGTGKTYCLTGLVLRLLLERKASGIDRILAVTFTNAATEQLVERIRTFLSRAQRATDDQPAGDPFVDAVMKRHGDAGRELLHDALVGIDDLAVCTIHGFCHQVLEEAAFESGVPFDLDLVETADDFLDEAARDFWRTTLYEDDLLAAIVAVRGWAPRRFLSDLKNLRRYPDVRVEPEPQPLAIARGSLARAIEEVSRSFDRSLLEKFFSPGIMNKGQTLSLSSRNLRQRLDGAERFSRQDGYDALGDIEAFTTPSVVKALRERDRPRINDVAFIAACDALHETIAALEHALRWAFIRDVSRRFELVKREAGVLTYDDLLANLRLALRDGTTGPRLARAVRERFDAVLIDEFQDTDLFQWEIFRSIFHETKLFLIGDPKQSIYRFRGADVFAYLDAASQAAHRFTLDRNWRSTSDLIAAVNAVFDGCPRPFVFDEIGFACVRPAGVADQDSLVGDEGKALEWLWAGRITNKGEAGTRIARAVAAHIADLLDVGMCVGRVPFTAAHIAVLVRTNEQAAWVQDALRRQGVPAVISAAGNVFASDEASDLACVLDAVVAPANGARIRAALATRVCGFDAAEIARLDTDEEEAQRQGARFDGYLDTWREQGFMAMMSAVLADFSTRSRMLELEDGERRLTDLLHTIELVHEATVSDQLAPHPAVKWFSSRRAEARERSPEAVELRLDSEAEAVRIVTMHKSKGLEYDVVFCPYLCDPISSTKQRLVVVHEGGAKTVADFDSPSREKRMRTQAAEDLAEAVRLAYVAMTRARRRCYVVAGVIGRSGERSAIAYLLCGQDSPGGNSDPGERVGAWFSSIAPAFRKNADRLKDALESLVRQNESVMGIAELFGSCERERRLPTSRRKASDLERRRFPEVAESRLRPWRISSFSSLQRGVESNAPDHADPAVITPAESRPEGIFALARGAQMGRCLHEILEHLDFGQSDADATGSLVAAVLSRHGLDRPEAHAAGIDPREVILDLLARLCPVVLPGQNFCLADVRPDRRLSEWSFHVPIGAMTTRDLVRLFSRYTQGRVRDEYCPRLDRLDEQRLEGFLTGFVDAVFEHGGRWYLVDWKSNHLGNDLASYGDDDLWRAMCQHDYVLQYHLYVLALHRFLKSRLLDYSYERDFGSVYYVFLRGTVGSRGWYRDKPPVRLVEALDEAVDTVEA